MIFWTLILLEIVSEFQWHMPSNGIRYRIHANADNKANDGNYRENRFFSPWTRQREVQDYYLEVRLKNVCSPLSVKLTQDRASWPTSLVWVISLANSSRLTYSLDRTGRCTDWGCCRWSNSEYYLANEEKQIISTKDTAIALETCHELW